MVEKRVVVADPMAEGHRAMHVWGLVQHLPRWPELHLVCALHPKVIRRVRPYMSAAARAQTTFVRFPARITRHIKINNKDLPNSGRALTFLQGLARRERAELIHFLHLDTFLIVATLNRLWRGRARRGQAVGFSGLLFAPTAHYPAMFGSQLTWREWGLGQVKKWLIRAAVHSRDIRQIFFFDEAAPPFYDPGQAKVKPVPDFAPIPDRAAEPSWVPEAWLSRPVRFLMFGSLSERKGLREFLAALDRLDDDELERISTLLVGQVQPDIATAFKGELADFQQRRPRADVTLIDAFVPDEAIWWTLTTSSCVVIPYRRHCGSSGVLAWAAHAGIAVVTQRFGLVGYETQTYQLGLTVPHQDVAALAEALRSVLAGGHRHAVSARGQAAYAQRHTEQAFARTMLNHLADP